MANRIFAQNLHFSAGVAQLEWSDLLNKSQSKTLQYEVSPLAIAISGDTAVVNYTVLQVTQRATDKRFD